jgi:transcriptional regulator with AAA-type ATPase domain
MAIGPARGRHEDHGRNNRQTTVSAGAGAKAGALPGSGPQVPPADFTDLIGQEPMVRTLTNAFETGRIAQAWMLTGVRGVGKTTTARILARALNYRPRRNRQADHRSDRCPASIARRSWKAAMSM